ncbi:MAG: cysteine desulfurase [Phycisphaerales bacterium]|nr:cysteine desulfurase [Phycisphaerales bacterium]
MTQTTRIADAFPALNQTVGDKPLVYLDSAATTQKPTCVIDAVHSYYEHDNANIHRGVHQLSMRATKGYEGARAKLAALLGASKDEIVFVRGATEAINLVAQAWGRPRLGAGDEILITEMEHHSNIVPWQLLCEQTGAALKVAKVNDDGSLNVDSFKELLGEDTAIAAFTHVSNAIGSINQVKELCTLAKAAGAVTVVDGAQATGHMHVDVQDIGCDFYATSGHKMFGPTGIGCLFGRSELLEEMEPYQGGGDMILSVSFEETTWNKVPFKFEAGTPNIAGAIGLSAACDYITEIGYDTIHDIEMELLSYGTKVLSEIDGATLVGTAKQKCAILAFTVDGVHPHDVGTICDHEGVAIRTGNHCAEPLMHRFGLSATCRASLSVYNTASDIDALATALRKAITMLA